MYQPYPASSSQLPDPVRAEAPRPVVLAVRLMYAGAVISALSLVVLLVTLGSLTTALHNAFPSYSSARISTMKDAYVGAVIFYGVLSTALWIWMAIANRAGHSWARIVATVLFGLNTLASLGTLARPQAGGSRLVSLAVWLLGLITIVLLYRRESSEYYSARGSR